MSLMVLALAFLVSGPSVASTEHQIGGRTAAERLRTGDLPPALTSTGIDTGTGGNGERALDGASGTAGAGLGIDGAPAVHLPAQSADLFQDVDANGDHLLGRDEMRAFITEEVGTADFNEADEVERGIVTAMNHANLHDAGGDHVGDVALSTLDVDLLWRELGHFMTTSEVVAWVEHAVQLPALAPRFREAAITGFDFPLLVENEGQSLREELGITSELQLRKLTRAIKMKLMGIGTVPDPVVNLLWHSNSCDRVTVSWMPPGDDGGLEVHKYVADRRVTADADSEEVDGEWFVVYDGEGDHFVDSGVSSHLTYEYRVRAWNPIGHSDYETIEMVRPSAYGCPQREERQRRQDNHEVPMAHGYDAKAPVVVAVNDRGEMLGASVAGGSSGSDSTPPIVFTIPSQRDENSRDAKHEAGWLESMATWYGAVNGVLMLGGVAVWCFRFQMVQTKLIGSQRVPRSSGGRRVSRRPTSTNGTSDRYGAGAHPSRVSAGAADGSGEHRSRDRTNGGGTSAGAGRPSQRGAVSGAATWFWGAPVAGRGVDEDSDEQGESPAMSFGEYRPGEDTGTGEQTGEVHRVPDTRDTDRKVCHICGASFSIWKKKKKRHYCHVCNKRFCGSCGHTTHAPILACAVPGTCRCNRCPAPPARGAARK